METVRYLAKMNSKKSQTIIGMKVYHGCVEVRHNGNYLYSKFTGITRLTPEDAIQDARNLVADTFTIINTQEATR